MRPVPWLPRAQRSVRHLVVAAVALAVACSPTDSPKGPVLTRLTPGAGFPEGGDLVTLTGSGLDTVSAVTLVPSDGSACPSGCSLTGVVKRSATSLQAVIPPQPLADVLAYDLRVTTPAGLVATLPRVWTYDHPRGRFQPVGLRMPMESGAGKSGRTVSGLFTPAWMGVVGAFTRRGGPIADVFMGGNGGRAPRLLQGQPDPSGSAAVLLADSSSNLLDSEGTPVEDGPFAIHRYDVFKPMVADLDQDGWPEVAFWNDATHAFTVFWNDAGRMTAREYPGPPGFDPTDLVGGDGRGQPLDFNLDGAPDFLLVGPGAQPILMLGCGGQRVLAALPVSAPASAFCFLGGSAPRITMDLKPGAVTVDAAHLSGFSSSRLTDFMATGGRWIVDVGPSTEIVTLSAVTADGFTTTFTAPHAAGAVLAPIIATTAHAAGPVAANTTVTVTLDDISGFALADVWLVADPGQQGEERIHLTTPAVDFAARTVTLSFSHAHPKDFALGVRDPRGFVLDDTRFNAVGAPYTVAAGDLDADGDVDVVLGNQGTGLQVFESSATQLRVSGQDPIAFSLSTSAAVMARFLPGDVGVGDVRALALVDVNSDSLADLLVGYGGGQERLFYNHGGAISGQPILQEGDPGSAPCAGGQPNRVPLVTGDSVVRYDVRDLDGDGKPDLLAFLEVCSPPDGTERPLRVWLNDGKGCFVDGMGGQADAGVTERFFATSLGVRSGWDYALGDINGDGLPDMVLGADGAQTREYVNVAGSFRDKTASNLASAVSATDSVRWWKHSFGALLVDLNGDGFSDLLVSQFDADPNVSGGTSACTGAQRVCAIGEGGVHVYLNDGQGNFSHDDTATVLPGPLPIASWSMDSAILYPGGPLGIVIASATEYQGGAPASLAGTPFASSYGATRLLTQAAGGSLADSTATWLPPDKTLRFVSSAKLVDLDDDGRMDLVLGDAASGQIQVWQGTPTGFTDVTATALPGGALPSPCVTNRVNQIVPGTLQGTAGGLPDLFLARDCQSRLLVNATVRGSGAIVLKDETSARLPSPAPAALSAVAGDLDCHGGNDLFLVTSTGEKLLAGGDCGSQSTCGVFTDISADVLPPPSLGSSCIGADCTGDARVIPLPMGGPGTDLFVARASSAFAARPHRILRNHCGRFAELTSYPSKPVPWDDDRISGVVAGDVFGHAGRDTGTDLVLVGDGVVRVYQGREFGPPTCTISGVTIAASPSSVHIGESSALHATLASSGTCSGGVTWSVSPSGGTLTPNGANATFSATTPGAYTIRAVSADAPSESGSVTVTVLGPAPVLGSVTPAGGPLAGGSSVTLQGSGFGASPVVTFGGAAARVVGTPTATVIQVITPPHDAGPVNVTVTNADGQSSTLAGGFTYQVTNAQPPAIGTLLPGRGSPAGGGLVVITGTGFNAPVVTFGGAAARVVGTPSATVIQVSTPPGSPGAVDVTVTNADGQSSTLAGGFTYQVTNQPPPAIGAVLPGRGPPAGGGLVLITGTGFSAPAVVTFGGVPASVVGAPTATVIQVSTPPHELGPVDVTVTNADGQSSILAGGFVYQATSLPPPVIATVAPNSGQPAGGGVVVITGTGFGVGAVVTFGGVPASVAGAPSATAIQVSPPPHAPGTVDVTVTNADGQSSALAGAYTYLAPGFGVSTVTPTGGSSGNQASATTVQAVLSAAIDCARATGTSLQVFEGATLVPGTAICSGSSLSFQPTGALPTFTTLQGHVDGAVVDLAGDSLGSAYDWSFGMAAWTRQAGSTAYDEARGVAAGPAGDVFVAGYTQGALDGNALTGTNDLFAVRYDRSGARRWTRQLGAAGASTYGLGAAVDSSGNLYVAGHTNGNLDGNITAGTYDMFLVKYDLGGTKQWTRELGTPGAENTGGVAVDGTGAVYVAGWTNGNFDGHVSAGAEDLFLVKYDPSGAKLWSVQHGSPAQDEATAVAVDASGNVLVAGFTTGRLDGNIFQGQTDAFVAKFSSDGAWIWSRAIGSDQRDQATGVAADGAGNVYLVGWTYGGLGGNLNLGGQDGFLAKYDPSGGLLWVRQVGTASTDNVLAVAVDAAGNPYVTGSTNGSMDGVSNLSSPGTNLFVARYDPNGNRVWAHQRASAPYGYDLTQAIALDGGGNVFAAGLTNGGMDGNLSAGNYDACVVKYELAGTPR